MPELALILYAVFLLLAFGWRTWLQVRRTGSSGFHGISGHPGSAEWLGGVLFVIALILGVLAPVLAIADVVEPIDALDQGEVHGFGLGLGLLGILGTLLAQTAMGSSWRIGVDEQESTDLVTSGPFAVVRNPIFSAMLPASLGLALMVPSVVAIAGALALLVAVELQVRVVEEPYLLTAHGETAASACSRIQAKLNST